MAITAPRSVNTQDFATQFTFDSVAKVVDDLNKIGFVNGRHVDDIVIQTGTPKPVNHLMRVAPRGYVIVKQNANAVIWQSSITSTEIVLNASADVTISLWVYV